MAYIKRNEKEGKKQGETIPIKTCIVPNLCETSSVHSLTMRLKKLVLSYFSKACVFCYLGNQSQSFLPSVKASTPTCYILFALISSDLPDLHHTHMQSL